MFGCSFYKNPIYLFSGPKMTSLNMLAHPVPVCDVSLHFTDLQWPQACQRDSCSSIVDFYTRTHALTCRGKLTRMLKRQLHLMLTVLVLCIC
ncbi:hypothetical protein MATL_G00049470 [Megalops atlanticus]|uniref:Uncharacterized protein n=1 Tax=Megalops atlanticus TaxID=7932 RepID=A0A9D3QCD0_MEGAT|nr:hypothetical protein MATL_G00049470 [Megalops atlanticus]